jgi:hypothetical protein
MHHIPISNSDRMSLLCSLFCPGASLISVHPRTTTYSLLSIQYAMGKTTNFVVCYFHYIHFCHSNIFLAAALDFFVLGIVLVRICMQRDHYLKYGVLLGRARHKSEAVSKTFDASNLSNNGVNDSPGQRPHLLGHSRSTA